MNYLGGAAATRGATELSRCRKATVTPTPGRQALQIPFGMALVFVARWSTESFHNAAA